MTTDELVHYKATLESEAARLDTQQMGYKIALNSAYGALGNSYFRFFDVRLAESVTLTGQLIIRWAEKCANEFMNSIMGTIGHDYVVASDTDSIYVDCAPLVEAVGASEKPTNKVVDFLDRFAKDLDAHLASAYADIGQYLNWTEPQAIAMKREAIADVALWCGKKRYILRVHDSEGVRYETPKLKIMGIETARSSTPPIVRKKLTQAIDIIMSGSRDALAQFISEFRAEFFTLPPEQIAFPRGVSDIRKWDDGTGHCAKGTPIHVRAAIGYNRMLQQTNVASIYPSIQDGTKMRFIYLRTPNPTKENVIGFVAYLPSEFGLSQYIDREKQFDSAFLAPVKNITTPIGWDPEQTATLEGLF